MSEWKQKPIPRSWTVISGPVGFQFIAYIYLHNQAIKSSIRRVNITEKSSGNCLMIHNEHSTSKMWHANKCQEK